MKHCFENFTTEDGRLATQYIISWVRAGGSLKEWYEYEAFYEWLIKLGLSEGEASDIRLIARFGSDELENSAKEFIKSSMLLND